jgi:hypothetical protein
MPAMKYLRFYLERNCVVMPGWGKTKNTRKGCGGWTLWHTKQNTDWLKKNAKVRNGTGGLLIVDVDPKNGGSLDLMSERFPTSLAVHHSPRSQRAILGKLTKHQKESIPITRHVFHGDWNYHDETGGRIGNLITAS